MLVENSHILYIINHSILILISLPYIQLHITPTHSHCMYHVSAYCFTLLSCISLFIFSLLTPCPFIISYSSIPSFKSLTAPLHLSLSSPYKVHSNNTCFSVSTSPYLHLSSSYLHGILSLTLTGKHPPLTISLIHVPIFKSAKLSFLGHSFICTYSFSLSVSLKPFFHTCLPTSLILLKMYLFQNSPFTFVPNFTFSCQLTSLNQIRLTNSKSQNLLHWFLHRDDHIDLHPNSMKHVLCINL